MRNEGGAGKGWSFPFSLKHGIDFCIYTSTFVAVNSKKYIRRKYSSNSICTIGFWNPNPCRSLGNLIRGPEQELPCSVQEPGY